ncbi:MucR family transcriptional regulator [Sphingomonas aerophila]|uniref:Putative transcriptional regulator n=1 Tax=Sphingomonas aerophila TaxID=1344948 RepID=A0A7W9BHD5_9SPHN|nr:MucR family transcriptional regulator [Sphingomonas aerophila]MBB5716906.1 putative transcriptional regulator [Sphingomonas aerophila]
MADGTQDSIVELATELTIAWLSNPHTRVGADEVPAFLARMHGAVTGLVTPAPQPEAPEDAEDTPAVSVRKSLASKDHILSMIDGKPYKTLRRHLAGHGLTPDQYRERYNLRPDYPMVAENYSEARRDMAKKIGLGRKPRVAAEPAPAEATPPEAAAPAAAPKRGRRKAGTAAS